MSSDTSLDLDQDVCSVRGCNTGSDMFAYSIPICDWHWALACKRRKADGMPDVLRAMLPRRDRHHVSVAKR